MEKTDHSLKRYDIIRRISKRLCYTLFEAEDKQTGERIHLKLLHENIARENKLSFSFLKAARISGVLNSEGIVQVSNFGKDQQCFFVASELNDLQPLNLFIHDNFPLDFNRALNIAGGICEVLRTAHLQGVIHGLLNPGSIFVAPDDSIKIDDFGYHWLAPFLHELEDAEALFLSYHIAPEVYHSVEIDGRTDIYSLGVILLQLLTDRVPFGYLDQATIPNRRLNLTTRAIRGLIADYPRRLEKILINTLQQSPERRLQSLRDFEGQISKLRHEYSYEMELARLEKEWLPVVQ